MPGAAFPALEATRHRGHRTVRTGNAVTLLTVYVVLLCGFPSNVTISALGALGRPALLWGLILLLVWMLTRLQRRSVDVPPPRQPVVFALCALLTIALIGFAAAMLRGQPADQVGVAVSGMLRLFSWTGVVLVAADGLRTHQELSTLVRRIVVTATVLAAFGLLQIALGATLLDWISSVPGLTVEIGGVDSRGAFVRAAATATHPLEFTATMGAVLPIAVATAVAGGYRSHGMRMWWVSPILLVTVSILAVSRSALIGVAVAAVASIPGLPRAYRWGVSIAALAAAAVTVVAVPGLFGTVVALFAGAGNDASTTSRTDALARLPEFFSASPLIGEGFGTFTSRYWIFDNQWAQSLIDLGALGVTALLALVVAAGWSAANGGRRSSYMETRTMGRAIAASVITMAVVFLFFDGLSFPIAAGAFFLVIGMSAAVRTIGVADQAQAEALSRLGAFPHDDPPVSRQPRPRTSPQGRATR